MEKRPSPSFTWIYAIALVVALAILGIGIYEIAIGLGDWTMLAAGCVSIVAIFITWPIALSLNSYRRAMGEDGETLLGGVTERLDQIAILMNLMSEQQLLSDRAKSVAFREKDLDALRRAIAEDMGKQDWDAAFVLADEIERSFGYHAEANRFREEITTRRKESLQRQVNDAIAAIDRQTRAEQWKEAQREAERLMTVFPDNEQIKNLPNEIEARRQGHKRQLLDSWKEAISRHDVDGSIEILKNLDSYLTSAEAESMQEAVRGVFKEKLANLGKQFALAVQDHKWADAIRFGDIITREFPNTRIAQEVREKMEALRKRANEPAAAGAT